MAGRKRPSIPGYYSIREFCERYSVSPSFYYKMQKEGGGPRETVLLGQRRKVIAHKAAEAWHARHNPPVTMVKAGPSGDNRYYTIEEFCKQYRISHSYYYQMQNRGAGPGEMKLGRKKLIPYEAAEIWRRKREAASTPTPIEPTSPKPARTKPAGPRKIEYVAKLDGAILGRRSSPNVYTHAIIAQLDEEVERRYAYAAKPQEYEREWFDRYAAVAKSKIGELYPGSSTRGQTHLVTADKINDAKKEIAGGFKAFHARQRQERIDDFERDKRDGRFEPRVVKWLRPEDPRPKFDPDKQNEWKISVLTYNFSRWKFARYVPAESVEHFSIAEAFAKLSETTRRTILTDICDKMLTRHAWDEIAALLMRELGADYAAAMLKGRNEAPSE